MQQRQRTLIFTLFFLSGISGLIYQIVWNRMLVLVFGNTLLANSTVLTAFMAGRIEVVGDLTLVLQMQAVLMQAVMPPPA